MNFHSIKLLFFFLCIPVCLLFTEMSQKEKKKTHVMGNGIDLKWYELNAIGIRFNNAISEMTFLIIWSQGNWKISLAVAWSRKKKNHGFRFYHYFNRLGIIKWRKNRRTWNWIGENGPLNRLRHFIWLFWFRIS